MFILALTVRYFAAICILYNFAFWNGEKWTSGNSTHKSVNLFVFFSTSLLAFDRIHISSEKWNNLFHRNNNNIFVYKSFFWSRLETVRLLFDWCFYADQTHTTNKHRCEKSKWSKRKRSCKITASVLFMSTVQESIFFFQVVFISVFSCALSVRTASM